MTSNERIDTTHPRLLAVMIGVALGIVASSMLWGLTRPGPLVGPGSWSNLDSRGFERREEIQAVLKEEVDLPVWAGEFSYGDGFDTNATLSLAPGAGFAFKWDGCLGLYGQNFGQVQVKGSLLTLDGALDNEEGGFGAYRSELVIVPWGNRTYLIAPEQMVAFCNDVHTGAESSTSGGSLYWMACGDESTHVTGTPSLPVEFRSTWDAPLIRAVVAEVLSVKYPADPLGYRCASLRLDLTLLMGAHSQMELTLSEPEFGGYFRATIESADEHGSVASLLLSADDPEPQVGWLFLRRP